MRRAVDRADLRRRQLASRWQAWRLAGKPDTDSRLARAEALAFADQDAAAEELLRQLVSEGVIDAYEPLIWILIGYHYGYYGEEDTAHAYDAAVLSVAREGAAAGSGYCHGFLMEEAFERDDMDTARAYYAKVVEMGALETPGQTFDERYWEWREGYDGGL
jgi:hypothetical protein